MTNTNVNTGSYIAIAGLIVSAASYFNFVISSNDVITIIAGIVAAYGVVHQFIVSRSVAKTSGLIK